MQRLRRFSRFWDLVANSGNFVETTPLLWRDQASPFDAFLRWSDWVYERTGRRHGIALSDLAERLFEYLTTACHHTPEETALVLWRDYQKAGRSDRPPFLRPYLPEVQPSRREKSRTPLKRQSRHLPA